MKVFFKPFCCIRCILIHLRLTAVLGCNQHYQPPYIHLIYIYRHIYANHIIFNQYYFRRNPYIQCKTRVQNFGCHITSKISCNKCKFLGWKKCLGLLPFPMLCIPMVVSQVSGQVVSDAKWNMSTESVSTQKCQPTFLKKCQPSNPHSEVQNLNSHSTCIWIYHVCLQLHKTKKSTF